LTGDPLCTSKLHTLIGAQINLSIAGAEINVC
jgi:hypothetical protein